VSDHADLIVRFFEAMDDRYSEWHDDPTLGPIIAAAREVYSQERRHGFTRAGRMARAHGVRAILALPMEPPP